jgi:peptidyl-prolyl cis-trans isomerase D
MLSTIRAFAKSWVAALLMGLLIFSFAVWGIRKDVFTGHYTDAVISAGSRTVSSAEFRREFEQAKSQVEQQSGQQIPTDVAVANGLLEEVLQGLATREAFAALVTKLGVQPSDTLVGQQIQKISAFFDPVTGRFDKRAYQQRLQENGLTPASFEGMVRDEVAEQQLGAGIVAGMTVPRAYAAMASVYMMEGRDATLFSLGANDVARPAAPTDAQLTSFMQENASQLMRPEFRQLTVVEFDPDKLGADAPVSQADLQKRFEFQKDSLSKPEVRTLAEVPAKDAAAAAQIAARLQKGEAPQAVAKAFGVDAIEYVGKPQSAIPDKKLAAAAFKLQSGQISQVQGDLGLAVVKVEAVTPGHEVTLDEVRPQLEAEIRKDAGAAKVDSMTQAYQDAHDKGASLKEAAGKAGATTIAIGPVAHQGLDQQGKPVQVNPKILDAAFSLPSGGESDLEETGDGGYFAVHVDKVVPPAMPKLADIRSDLARAWTLRELDQRLQAKADELAGKVRKGETLAAAAASVGAKVTPVKDVTRATASQDRTVSPAALGQVFSGKPGDVFTARDRQFGYVVGKIDAVHAPAGDTAAKMAQAMGDQMTVAYVREVENAARLAARKKVKVSIDVARARTALGLEPEPKGGAKPGGSK